MRPFVILAVCLFAPHANAQIGWTLDQCRKHFGHEFGVKGDVYCFSADQSHEHVCVTFDPDGTVGSIFWFKLNGMAFSEEEIQARLKQASRVTWRRSQEHNTGELNWTGEQDGQVLFDANEAKNEDGIYRLTITTR